MEQAFQLKQGLWQLEIQDENYDVPRRIAASCADFIPDDEDEQVDDIVRSCVNCGRRRWLINAIQCTAR